MVRWVTVTLTWYVSLKLEIGTHGKATGRVCCRHMYRQRHIGPFEVTKWNSPDSFVYSCTYLSYKILQMPCSGKGRKNKLKTPQKRYLKTYRMSQPVRSIYTALFSCFFFCQICKNFFAMIDVFLRHLENKKAFLFQCWVWVRSDHCYCKI